MIKQRTKQPRSAGKQLQLRQRKSRGLMAAVAAICAVALVLIAVRSLSTEQRQGPRSSLAYGGDIVGSATPWPTGQPTAPYDPRVLQATAMAIMTTLPTPTLELGLPLDKARDDVARALSDEAFATAGVLYPMPTDYVPWAQRTLTPEPVFDTPIPHNTPTAHGMIRDGVSPGPPCSNYLYEANEWEGQLNGERGNQFTLACVGVDKSDFSYGGLVIRVGSHDPEQPSQEYYYRTATQSGSLRIIDEQNGQIIIRTADSSLLRFDLTARQWVIAPTPGPSPSTTTSPILSVAPLPTPFP